MIKIGITGGSGTLGKSLIKLFKQKKIVTSNYKFDILNKKKINSWIKQNQFNIIIHLAASVPTSNAIKNFHLVKKINYVGTKNLVEAIKKYQKKKNYIFFSSTSHVYQFSNNKLSENDITKTISKYGKTKLMAEKFLIKNNKFYNLCIGRISSLVSENQSSEYFLLKLINKKKSKKFINFGNANIKRNFIYVDDVSKIILKIIKQNFVGIVNISSNEVTKFSKLFDFLNKYYKFNITYHLSEQNYLDLSNKLLQKVIGKYKFISLKKIIKKLY